MNSSRVLDLDQTTEDRMDVDEASDFLRQRNENDPIAHFFEENEQEATFRDKSSRAPKRYRKRTIAFKIFVVAVVLIIIPLVLLIYFTVESQNTSSTMKAFLNGSEENVQGMLNQGEILTTMKPNSTERGENDLDCGGIINLPETKAPYYLNYKRSSSYAPNENCLWIIENTRNSIRSQLTITVELIAHGFKGKTGLFALSWNRDTNLTSEEITSGKQHALSAEGLYLSFTSDGEKSMGGTGFFLGITVTQKELKNYGSNSFFGKSSGSQTVFSHYDSDQISIAIDAKIPIAFNLTRAFSKEKTHLFIYEIEELGKFQERGRLTGIVKEFLSISTTNPILLLYVSDQGSDAQRFRCSWAKKDINGTMVAHPVVESTPQWNLRFGLLGGAVVFFSIVAFASYYAEFHYKNPETGEFVEEGVELNGESEKKTTKAAFSTSTPSNSAQWVECSNGFLPSNAVEGGHEGSDTVYVARAYYRGILTPGKFHSGLKTCYISWSDKEYDRPSYEVLVANPGDLYWSAASKGHFVRNAVVGGQSETGEKLFIGRFNVGDALIPGKIHPSHKRCFVPFNGAEIHSNSYECLRAKNYSCNLI